MKVLTQHLNESGLTYLQHLVRAFGFLRGTILASAALTIHAFLPFLFTRTASAILVDLNEKMKER
jgi:uncharacterized membrane protein YdjX (TVP38/TMEM64 family)